MMRPRVFWKASARLSFTAHGNIRNSTHFLVSPLDTVVVAREGLGHAEEGVVDFHVRWVQFFPVGIEFSMENPPGDIHVVIFRVDREPAPLPEKEADRSPLAASRGAEENQDADLWPLPLEGLDGLAEGRDFWRREGEVFHLVDGRKDGHGGAHWR